ncbi:MAG TPA: serine hydrolase [Candidatus Acidoferrales bacterium]
MLKSKLLALVAFLGFAVVLPAQTTTPDATTAQRMAKIESDVVTIPVGAGQPALHLSLAELMAEFHDPGLSLAVVDHFQIVYTKAYGVVATGSTDPVTPTTLFQAGSISKPVAATGALWLVEHGKLSLDEDVNKKLLTWKVPDNDFTKTEKVTLRRILSHTAGLTVHGFGGYPVGDPIPTIPQVLNGEKPANSPAVRVEFVPGSKVQYSGGGVTIEQQLVIDVTQKPFPEFMKQVVLDKIGMTNSTYEQPIPAALAPRTATGTYADGTPVKGRWHIYPEMAAAGLWTTPTDLAKFGIEIAASKNGKSNKVLSESMTRQMLSPQLENAGLGFFFAPHNTNQFAHGGADEGFQSMLVMLGDEGQGVAVMANSDNGVTVANYLIDAIATEFAWKFEHGKPSAGDVLQIVGDKVGAKAALREYQDLKKSSADSYSFAESDLNLFGYALINQKKYAEAIDAFQMNVEMYPQSFNVYDSLAEAQTDAGEKDAAIQNYKKSLELNPQNANATKMLEKLNSSPK